MKKLSAALLFLLIMTAAFILQPGPVDSVSWMPPPAPSLRGATAPNDLLKQAELIAREKIYGPEDIDVDPEGRIYGGTQDGKVVRITPSSQTTNDSGPGNEVIETLAETGGRPLGLHFDHEGRLVIADAYKGLLIMSTKGNWRVLTSEANNQPFGFTNDLDIASDGTIYFTDSSTRFNQSQYMLDLFESRPYGRFLAYHPNTNTTEVLLDKLYFPNGVALSQQEDFVLINETWRYRIWRYWLKGPRAGTAEIFIDNLPGFPDGISSNRQGIFWLALPTLRNPQLDAMHPHPFLKNLSAKLPAALRPKPVDYGLALALNEEGKIIGSLHDITGEHLKEITSVQQKGNQLYFGSLHNNRIGRLPVSAIPFYPAAADLASTVKQATGHPKRN